MFIRPRSLGRQLSGCNPHQVRSHHSQPSQVTRNNSSFVSRSKPMRSNELRCVSRRTASASWHQALPMSPQLLSPQPRVMAALEGDSWSVQGSHNREVQAPIHDPAQRPSLRPRDHPTHPRILGSPLSLGTPAHALKMQCILSSLAPPSGQNPAISLPLLIVTNAADLPIKEACICTCAGTARSGNFVSESSRSDDKAPSRTVYAILPTSGLLPPGSFWCRT